MATYSIISDNSIDKRSTLNVLRQFIFGNKKLEPYDILHTYNTGDCVYIIDSSSVVHVYSALSDNIGGMFDSTKWESVNLANQLFKFSDVISDAYYRPKSKNIKVWAMPLEYTAYNIPVRGYDESEIEDPNPYVPIQTSVASIIFDTAGIPIVDDADTSELNLVSGDIVIDWEGEDVYIPTNDDIDAANGDTVVVDEQRDVHVGDQPPLPGEHPFIWIDTDLTDDNL